MSHPNKTQPGFASRIARALVRRMAALVRRILTQLSDDRELSDSINQLYQQYLGRTADREGLEHFVRAMRRGMSLSGVAAEIGASPEAERRQKTLGVFDALSDSEFILGFAELLFASRGITPRDIEYWRSLLDDVRPRRMELVKNTLMSYFDRQPEYKLLREVSDPNRCWLLGTNLFLTPDIWRRREAELSFSKKINTNSHGDRRQPFKQSGEILVSAIASLYKGGPYIEKFLENITSQTMFDSSELIIIDADSPDGEEEIIKKYQKTYPNIVYLKINYRLGIYDAWNLGVSVARGKYLTNTNLDDLRRADSFALQSSALDKYDFADVVYQDVYYTLDASLDFSEIERFGFKTEVPIITKNNLLQYNSPHNAPMWRRTLHDEVGMFDVSFKSAGDWEFWLRCLSRGKNFLKIGSLHVAYFQNPEGISTRPDTAGIEEGGRVLHRYGRQLISPYLLMSRESFSEALGISPLDSKGPYYDVVQRELIALGSRRWAEDCAGGA